jgi:hypothetical protein
MWSFEKIVIHMPIPVYEHVGFRGQYSVPVVQNVPSTTGASGDPIATPSSWS